MNHTVTQQRDEPPSTRQSVNSTTVWLTESFSDEICGNIKMNISQCKRKRSKHSWTNLLNETSWNLCPDTDARIFICFFLGSRCLFAGWFFIKAAPDFWKVHQQKRHVTCDVFQSNIFMFGLVRGENSSSSCCDTQRKCHLICTRWSVVSWKWKWSNYQTGSSYTSSQTLTFDLQI